MSAIDDYISGFPDDVQKVLKKVRATIRKAAPDAEEAIKYQIPAFVQNGNLVFFAGYKKHVGVYPVPAGTQAFQKQIAPYKAGKGTLRFPLDEPIPYELIAELVKYRLKESR